MSVTCISYVGQTGQSISCSWFKILHISTMNISKWLLYKNYSMLYIHDKAKRHRVTNNFFLIYEITNSYFATSYIADIPPISEIR